MKHLIITGASQGIGRATADYFLQEGWNVTNISRHINKAINNITADFSKLNWQDSISGSIQSILKNADTICLIHNAGLLEKDSIQTVPARNLRNVLEINLVAPSILNQIILPFMQEGSSIIYIGSTLSEKAVKNTASYVISKHALLGMMRATTQDLAETGIHTCCICPGFTDTEMLRTHVGNDPKIIKSISDNVTAKRLISPAEIAAFAYFCATNPVINGAVLHANLGQIEH